MDILREEAKKKGAFFIEDTGERLAEILYFHSGSAEITAYHTEVDERLRGQRIGDKLIAALVEYARDNNLKLVAKCQFAKKVIDKTPEYQDVLA